MTSAQKTGSATVLIHPATCSNPIAISEFQQRTGLTIVITRAGKPRTAQVPGGAA